LSGGQQSGALPPPFRRAADLAWSVAAVAVFVAAAGLGLHGAWKSIVAPHYEGRAVGAEPIGGDFTLEDPDGRPVALSRFRGKVVLLAFGYTRCPDVCPTTLARFAQARALLGADATQVQVLFVTVDPERDTGELMRQYVPAFDPSFIGLRGSTSATERVATQYGVSYKIVELQGQVLVDHSAIDYLIDRTGRTRVLLPYALSAQQVARDLRTVLDD